MKAGQTPWTREQLILAINLYCKTPFGRLHRSNPDVISLAKLLGRTPSSVAWKLVNFASLDPSLQARGIKGAENASKLDKEIWNEFYNDWEKLAFESETKLAEARGKNLEDEALADLPVFPKGKERRQLVYARVNQAFFRSTILAAYNSSCCITGIQSAELLIASHIIPWAKDKKNRMNPSNGLCINALHDKAFEAGLLSITPKYEIVISPKLLKRSKKEEVIADYFERYQNKSIKLPHRFLPDRSFLERHFEERFQR